jgi:RNA polymerase sigma-70 factor (ECF subfamily)
MESKLHFDAERITAHGTAPSKDDADRAEHARIAVEHQDALFKYIFKRLQDYHLAQDILQLTFRAAWEKRHTRKPHLPPLPWLKKIAFHKISDHFEAESAQKRGGGNDGVTVVVLNPNGEPQTDVRSDVCVAPGLEPWQEASQNELGRALRLAIGRLAMDEREILRMRYCEKLPVAEIAAFFNRTDSAVTATLHRLRAKLKQELKAMGFSDPSSEVNRHLKGDIM